MARLGIDFGTTNTVAVVHDRGVFSAVLHQAQNIGYIDSFWFATLNFVLMLPLILLVRTPARGASPPAHVSAE